MHALSLVAAALIAVVGFMLVRKPPWLRPQLRLVGALFPEVPVAVALFDAIRARLHRDDPERGDAIQWVVLTAVGAAIAITVGTIIYNKLTSKANSIDVNTPGQ
jgi:hypothetical protein